MIFIEILCLKESSIRHLCLKHNTLPRATVVTLLVTGWTVVVADFVDTVLDVVEDDTEL